MSMTWSLIALAAAFGGIYLFIDACSTLMDNIRDDEE